QRSRVGGFYENNFEDRSKIKTPTQANLGWGTNCRSLNIIGRCSFTGYLPSSSAVCASGYFFRSSALLSQAFRSAEEILSPAGLTSTSLVFIFTRLTRR